MAPIPVQREKRIVGTSLKMYFDLPSTAAYISSVATPKPPTSTSS
jgi:hypothetical protein